MNTDSSIQSLLRDAFPVGSPNVTVSDPWQKKAETCSWSTDSYLIHHFEDTVFVDTNDLCSLAPGLYTWIATADYQLSFAQFINTYEFSSKHANIALKRTGFVAGEIAVIPGSSRSREQISWNLMSVSHCNVCLYCTLMCCLSLSRYHRALTLSLYQKIRTPTIQWRTWRTSCTQRWRLCSLLCLAPVNWITAKRTSSSLTCWPAATRLVPCVRTTTSWCTRTHSHGRVTASLCALAGTPSTPVLSNACQVMRARTNSITQVPTWS